MNINNLKRSFGLLSGQEKANVLTHTLGFVLVLVSAPILLISEPIHTAWYGLLIFIFGMAFTYFSSSYYHLQTDNTRSKNYWRIIDHISIFVLIGSTYTPFILFYYNEPNGHTFLFVHWMIIVGGILFKLVYKTKYEIFSLTLYLLLGWMVLIIYEPISADMSNIVKMWLFMGGLSYTTGILFYVWKKLYYHHAIWHIFVILGSLGHYLALVNS